MASKLIGSTHCPECGCDHAEIKVSIEAEGKKPYRYCATGCGAAYHPRTAHQVKMLMEKIKGGQPEPEEEQPPKDPPRTQPPAAPAAPASDKQEEFEMVFGVRVPKRKAKA
ncbi:hypothetical protein [Herbaspirillum huttiense]|uniref:hypothetical protein n=1 Tax=Herbaspirillum huttiense TaxID=863372 RepID=UPI003F2F7349